MLRALSTGPLAALGLAAVVALLASTARADESGPAGLVSDIRGSSGDFRVVRGSQSSPPYLLEPLQLGDEVMVVKPADSKGIPNTITLDVNGHLHVLTSGAPLCVGKVSCEPGAATDPDFQSKGSLWGPVLSLIALVAPTLREASDDYTSAKSAPLASRGAAAPPSLPILAVTPLAAAPAGLAALVIPISGGVPPLHVRLYAAGGTAPIAEQQIADGNEAHLRPPELGAGTYRVTIDDAANASVTATFAAVDKADIPPPAPAIQLALDADQSFIRDAAFVGYAAYLKDQGPRWYLTAYQELQNTSPGFSAAQPLLFRLGEGP